MQELRQMLRRVPNFPKPGISFKDITPILNNGEAFTSVIDALCGLAALHSPPKIVGIESRGFILGSAVAYAMHLPFVPARKKGKLPAETVQARYALEYGEDVLEMHKDALVPGDRVVVIDDLLATGGTAEAVCHLVESLGAELSGLLFLIELTELQGVKRLASYPVHVLIRE